MILRKSGVRESVLHVAAEKKCCRECCAKIDLFLLSRVPPASPGLPGTDFNDTNTDRVECTDRNKHVDPRTPLENISVSPKVYHMDLKPAPVHPAGHVKFMF